MHFLRHRSTSPPLTCFLLLVAIRPSSSIPHPTSAAALIRQSSFESLDLPQCALTCFITSLTNDGCASETDFRCHCTGGTVLSAAEACLSSGCAANDSSNAIREVRAACRAAGIDLGEDGDGGTPEGNPSSSTADGASTTASTLPSNPPSPIASSSSAPISSSPPPSSNSASPPSSSTSTPSASLPETTSTPLTSQTHPTTTPEPPPTPSNTPLSLLPNDRQLSAGAKAGIIVGVIAFFFAVFLALSLYIRRLKRDLRAAQAAAGISEPDFDIWQTRISAGTVQPVPQQRRKSWRGRVGSGTPPVSPLSPRDMGERGRAGGSVFVAGSFLKRNRRSEHVLSVVEERIEEEDDDGDAASTDMMVREPVPGQKEGLVDPLELDGYGTVIVELPTSVTPRTRSRERSRERSRSREAGRRSREERDRGRYGYG